MKTVSAIFAALALMPTACSSSGVTVTEADNDSVVEIAEGEEITVELEGNASTGFNWFLAEYDESVVEPTGEIDYQQTDSDAVGVGGTYTQKLKGVGTGRTAVVYEYERSFEEEAPADTFTIEVDVTS
jgi:inhibitor of cysteine peptidase